MIGSTIRRIGSLSALLVSYLICAPSALAEVSPQGSFRTQISIALPGGIQGIKPNIALTYDSNGGNGIAGIGWEIAGIPSIQRLEPQTGYTFSVNDAFRDVDGDLYQLTHNTLGEYRFGNRRENWLLYRAKSGCPGDICSWSVTDRSGNTLTFGGTPDSVTYFNSPSGTIPRAWYLSEYRDRYGNFYTITYQRTAPFGTVLPASIEYTKNARADASGRAYGRWLATFTYEERPEILATTEQGFPVQIDLRLKSIGIAFKSADGTARPFRTYSLRYAPAVTPSRLVAVEESGTGGAAEVLRTEFAWQTSSPTMAVLIANTTTSIRDALSQWAGGTSAAAIRLIDQNGDGLQDLVVLDKTTLSVVHGSSLIGPVFSGRTVSTSIDIALASPIFADFDGDGYTDILSLSADAGSSRLLLGQRDGTFIADTALISLGATLGLQKTNLEKQKVLVADIDGDGRSDVLLTRDGQPTKIAFSSDPSQPLGRIEENLPDEAPAQLTPSRATVLVLADFNGDGKSDLFRCGNDDRTFVRLWEGTPNRTFGAPIEVGATAAAECKSKAPLVELADVNSDGQLDVLVRAKNADRIDTHTFRQSVFKSTSQKLTRTNAAEPSSSFTGDFTGDGAPDLLLVDCDAKGCTASLYPREGETFAQNPLVYSDFPAGAAATDMFESGDFDGDRTLDLLYAKRSNAVMNDGAFRLMLGSARGLHKAEFKLYEAFQSAAPQPGRWDRRPLPLAPVALEVEGGTSLASKLTFLADGLAVPILTDLNGDGRTDIFVAGNASKDKQSFALTSRFMSIPKLDGILSPTGALTSIHYQPKRTDVADPDACVPIATDSSACGLRDESALDVVKSIATWLRQPRSVWTDTTNASPDELISYEFMSPTYFPLGPRGPKWAGFRKVIETDEVRRVTIERRHHQSYSLAGLLAQELKSIGGNLHSVVTRTNVVLKSSDEDAGRSEGIAELVRRETTDLHSDGELSARKWREYAYSFGYSISNRECIAAITNNNLQVPICFDTISDVVFPHGPHRPVLAGIRRQTVADSAAAKILDWTRFQESSAEGEPLLIESRLLCSNAETCVSAADGQFHAVALVLARDEFGQATKTKDVLGRPTETKFDPAIPEAVVQQTDIFGNSTQFTLDEWGRAKTATDANGAVTTYAYDGLGRLARTDFASPGTFERRRHMNEGDASKQYVEITRSDDDLGNIITMRDYLDGSGYIYRTARSGPAGRDIVVDRVRKRQGGLLTTFESEAFFSDSKGPRRWRATSFDAFDRPTYSRWLQSSVPGDLDHAKPESFQSQRIEYRADGLKIVKDGRPYAMLERVDAQGRVTERVRATEDRNASVWHEFGAKTKYDYDAAGRLKRLDVAEPDGSDPRSIEQTFDSWGRRLSLKERNGGQKLFRVRLDGEIELETHADGAAITKTYQPDGRLSSVLSAPDKRAFTFTYDESDVTKGKGRLTRIKSAAGDEWRFGYDAMGRISQKTYTVAGLRGRTFTESFSYDGAGRVASRRMPEGSNVSFRYSPAGTLAAVLVNGLEVARWEDFDPEGRPSKRITRGAAPGMQPEIETKYAFAGAQLDSVVHTRSSDRQEIAKASYKFKPTSEIETITATGVDGKSARTRYDYDEMGRLKVADVQQGAKSVFTYNTFGDVETFGGRANRTLRYRDEGADNSYSVCDELSEGSCTNVWEFDAKGQLASHVDAQQERHEFAFSADGLLLSATKARGAKLSYDYDALGLRTRTTVTEPNKATLNIYFIGSDFEIHQVGDQDADQRYSLHIGTPDGTRLVTITTKPSRNASLRATPLLSLPAIAKATATDLLPPEGTWFYHVNHLGSIWFVTDAKAQVEYRATYFPYGEPMQEHGDPVSRFSFTGARVDYGTGFIYLSGRYYEPRIGRFISPDPFLVSGLGDTSAGNRYAYANNQPLNYVDPSGYGWNPKRDLRNLRDDLERDTRNLGRHLEAGVRDLGRMTEAVVREGFRGARQFGKDLVNDPLYAVVHIPRYTIRYPERAVRNGLLQSEELTVVAMVAVSITTGPMGTGAFTAYMTFAAGGSIEDAAKAGAIAWATGELMSRVDLTYAKPDEALSRVIAKGAISGASAAARDGSFEDGFKAGATSAVIAETLTAMTGKSPTYESGSESRLKPDGYSTDDLRQHHMLKHVGSAVSKKPTSLLGRAWYHVGSEGGFVMDHVADIPGMSYLGYIHDYFVVSLEQATNKGVGMLFNQTTIASAIAVNYYALGLHRDRMLLELSIRDR